MESPWVFRYTNLFSLDGATYTPRTRPCQGCGLCVCGLSGRPVLRALSCGHTHRGRGPAHSLVVSLPRSIEPAEAISERSERRGMLERHLRRTIANRWPTKARRNQQGIGDTLIEPIAIGEARAYSRPPTGWWQAELVRPCRVGRASDMDRIIGHYEVDERTRSARQEITEPSELRCRWASARSGSKTGHGRPASQPWRYVP